MYTVLVLVTVEVLTVNVPVAVPAGIVILVSLRRTSELLFVDSCTIVLPAPAMHESVAVASDVPPPRTLLGLSVKDFIVIGRKVSTALLVAASSVETIVAH